MLFVKSGSSPGSSGGCSVSSVWHETWNICWWQQQELFLATQTHTKCKNSIETGEPSPVLSHQLQCCRLCRAMFVIGFQTCSWIFPVESCTWLDWTVHLQKVQMFVVLQLFQANVLCSDKTKSIFPAYFWITVLLWAIKDFLQSFDVESSLSPLKEDGKAGFLCKSRNLKAQGENRSEIRKEGRKQSLAVKLMPPCWHCAGELEPSMVLFPDWSPSQYLQSPLQWFEFLSASGSTNRRLNRNAFEVAAIVHVIE